jgi:hypothetical protein
MAKQQRTVLEQPGFDEPAESSLRSKLGCGVLANHAVLDVQAMFSAQSIQATPAEEPGMPGEVAHAQSVQQPKDRGQHPGHDVASQPHDAVRRQAAPNLAEDAARIGDMIQHIGHHDERKPGVRKGQPLPPAGYPTDAAAIEQAIPVQLAGQGFDGVTLAGIEEMDLALCRRTDLENPPSPACWSMTVEKTRQGLGTRF